jgi:subtilisin-like proprotein convertase family protein
VIKEERNMANSFRHSTAIVGLLIAAVYLCPLTAFAQAPDHSFQKGKEIPQSPKGNGEEQKDVPQDINITPLAVFTNPAAITIPNATAPAPASPYPSNITVSGLTGTISKVTVTITGLNHTFPDDIDMLLVGPTGAKFLFWSDVGGSVDASGLNITLDDAAASNMPDVGGLSSGTFKPTDCDGSPCTLDNPEDVAFPAPAPAPPYSETGPTGSATFANIFNGTNPNGTWSLYIIDDSLGDAGSISGGWSLNITENAPPTAAGQLIISEFRLRGPAGPDDEYIELYNTTSSSLTVQAADASAGLGVTASDGVARCTIPNGTVIPARGHFLCANSGSPNPGTRYSLSSYPSGNNGVSATTATPDATYTTDISDVRGIALFSSASTFNLANRLDAVGPAGEANTTYKEGTGLAALPTVAAEYSVYRIHDLATGLPIDTGNNVTDFRFVATNANATVTNASLGAPGPENTTSPIIRNSTIKASLVAPCVASSAAPNRIRTGSGNSGSLSIRRRFTNNTGANVTRLRFRIIDITTSPAPNGSTAILAATNSTTTTEAQPCPSGTVTINGLTLETPPTQALGGGYNSSLSAGTVTLGTPIAAGASINVNFLLNISQAGSFRFFVNVEALP